MVCSLIEGLRRIMTIGLLSEILDGILRGCSHTSRRQVHCFLDFTDIGAVLIGFKAITGTPPSDELKENFNVTWDTNSYGDGPIHASFAPWIWPGQSK